MSHFGGCQYSVGIRTDSSGEDGTNVRDRPVGDVVNQFERRSERIASFSVECDQEIEECQIEVQERAEYLAASTKGGVCK